MGGALPKGRAFLRLCVEGFIPAFMPLCSE